MRLSFLAVFVAMSTACYMGCASPTSQETGDSVSDVSATDPTALPVGDFKIPTLTADERAAVLASYANIQHAGVRQQLFEDAMVYFDTNKALLPNQDWVTIVDFSLDSGHKRFYVLDMNGGPMTSHMVAHGHNSDPNDTGMATSFSNVEGSLQSSLGFYFINETYNGVHGESIRIDGLSSTNSNVRSRYVVVHDATYVSDSNTKQGRSDGCFALSQADKPLIVQHIKNGSLLYAMK